MMGLAAAVAMTLGACREEEQPLCGQAPDDTPVQTVDRHQHDPLDGARGRRLASRRQRDQQQGHQQQAPGSGELHGRCIVMGVGGRG